MHREALSRSILYSHTLFGKPVGALICSRNLSSSRKAIEGLLWPRPLLSPSRCYHRTWKNTAQPVAEAKAASSDGSRSSLDETVLPDENIKKFNLKAKDILDTSDETIPNDAPTSAPVISSSSQRNMFTDSNLSSLDSKISASRRVEELLNMSSESELTLKHACLIIARLGSISKLKMNVSLTELKSDKRFLQLFNLIQRGNHSQFPHTLLQALNGLQKLGLENSPEVLRLVERELSWSMRRCPLRFLAKSVRILHDQSVKQGNLLSTKTSSEEQNILQSAIKVLHRRWIEAINGNDFVSLFQIIELLDDERKRKIEERAADVAQQFTPAEIIKMFVVLGSKKRRPTPLLRALSFHFCNSEYKCNGKEAIELIYSLNELTFAEPILMNKLCLDVSEEIVHIKSSAQISSLVTSLGQMRYKQKDILLAVDEWITKRLDKLRVFDYAAWTLTAATLDYSSQNLPLFCTAASEHLTQSTVSSPIEWVNIVHAFAVLSQLQNEMLASVLNPKFVENLEKLGSKSVKQKIKLLNLNFLASKRKHMGYTGELLQEDVVKEWSETLVSSNDEQLSKLVIDSLATFLPPQKYLELNSALASGIFLDAKCLLDSKLMPTTLDAGKSSSSNLKKVAFVVEGYPDMCLGVKNRTGQSSLCLQMLEADGYLVVDVPYTEFGYSDKLVRRVQYLQQRLKSVSQISEDNVPGK